MFTLVGGRMVWGDCSSCHCSRELQSQHLLTLPPLECAGSPAKKFAVIVDTGSTMTYVPCSTCGSGCGPNHQDAAFDPEARPSPSARLSCVTQLLLTAPVSHALPLPLLVQASRTASLIACTSPKCECGSPRCGCAAQQCTYTRSYAEQSSSSGILVEDLLALHDGEDACASGPHSCMPLQHMRWLRGSVALCPPSPLPGPERRPAGRPHHLWLRDTGNGRDLPAAR